ncbi:hypothetical protein [Microbacterium sp. 5K110]|jgi:replication-associated recombination protein RarA|nr:hypothetical protein [Microbacterium sp. 5K110]
MISSLCGGFHAQWNALLPGVENGWVVLIASATENPSPLMPVLLEGPVVR